MNGIGKYLMEYSNYLIKYILKYDFRTEVVNVRNVAMYRLYTNSNDNIFSFGCRNIKFGSDIINISNNDMKAIFIQFVTVFNKDVINSIKSIIEKDERYEEDLLYKLVNYDNYKDNPDDIYIIKKLKAEMYKVKE